MNPHFPRIFVTRHERVTISARALHQVSPRDLVVPPLWENSATSTTGARKLMNVRVHRHLGSIVNIKWRAATSQFALNEVPLFANFERGGFWSVRKVDPA